MFWKKVIMRDQLLSLEANNIKKQSIDNPKNKK